MFKGIFWCCRDSLSLGDETLSFSRIIPVRVKCDLEGNCLEETTFSSKSGENFNHKLEWDKIEHEITKGKPFNYYPRGRVEIAKGKIKVFANPVIFDDEDMLRSVLGCFEIEDEDVTFVADNSYHYQYLYYQEA